MKQFITLSVFLIAGLIGFAQGKSKEKNKDKQKTENSAQTTKGSNNNDATQQNGNSKARKNIPTKVRSSFTGEYPNATNATWTKNRGDWTVVFGNGVWRSTATYHSNGERIDTRTSLSREQAPRSVIDEILRRFPTGETKDIIKIEKPKNPSLFQIILNEAGKKRTLLLDEKGKLVLEQ